MYIGVDLGGTKIESARVAASGQVLERLRVDTPRGDYAATLAAIADLVATLDPSGELPVGIGTPGVWVADQVAMKNCNSTWLNGQPLKPDIESALGQPVKMANDANCFALAEATVGAGRDIRSVFGVILGTGVGGGFVIDGKVWEGASGLAGEWGHIPLPYLRCDPDLEDELYEAEQRLAPRQCYCRRWDCVETYLSGPGLAQTHESLTGHQQSAETLSHDDIAVRLYRVQLARALAQIVNVVDPHRIVLGGGVSNHGAIYDGLHELTRAYVFSGESATEILPAAGGDSHGVVGAAMLCHS